MLHYKKQSTNLHHADMGSRMRLENWKGLLLFFRYAKEDLFVGQRFPKPKSQDFRQEGI